MDINPILAATVVILTLILLGALVPFFFFVGGRFWTKGEIAAKDEDKLAKAAKR